LPLAVALLTAACDPSGVFIDPTGKTCAGGVSACPDGWSCVPALEGTGTICWPTADAGAEDAGEDAGVPDSGFVDAGKDAGPDAGHDAGVDGGVPDGSVPDSGPTSDGGASCTIGGESIPAGTVNPASACQSCQPSVSAVAWSNLVDGKSCAADGGSNLCVTGVCSSVCAIDGGFVAAAQVNPANACEECEPALSSSSWSILAAGTSCATGMICASGSCAADCDIGGTVVVGNTVSSTNPCQICLPASSTSSWSDMPDALACGGTNDLCASGRCVFGCDIGGSAVDAGTSQAGDPCESCEPSQSSTGWTAAAEGVTCPGGICVSGSCADDCNIGGSFIPANMAEASNPCQLCLPATSPTSWSNAADGASCGAGLVCSSGHCIGGCGVGGVAVDAGGNQPGNPCATCDPEKSTTSYANVANGTACGTGLTCSNGSCCGGTYGTLSCSGAPSDTCVDDLNCGYCGNACGAPNGCFAGQCGLPAPLPTARDSLAAATGADGRIYAIGGYDLNTGNVLATVEIFDPRTNLWTTGASLPTAAQYMGAASTASGIFVMGGGDANYDAYDTGQFLDISTGIWSKTSAAPMPFMDNTPAVGPGGTFFMPGGCDITSGVCNPAGTSQVLKFTPTGTGAGGTWALGPSLPFATDLLGDTAGLNGTIYAISGAPDDTTPISNLQILVPGATAWSQGPDILTPRCDFSAATDNAGLIYAIGGDNCPETINYTVYANTEIFSPDAGTWVEGPAIPTGVTTAGCTLGPDGRIYVIGGTDGFSDQTTVQVYNPVTQNWIP
jgi:hypothetical protein